MKHSKKAGLESLELEVRQISSQVFKIKTNGKSICSFGYLELL